MQKLDKLKLQKLTAEQRICRLKQKQLDENRARVALTANAMLKRISLSARESLAAKAAIAHVKKHEAHSTT